jgi:2-phospho-L-lactate/phosphoenolpyruvate guanylyltransferase
MSTLPSAGPAYGVVVPVKPPAVAKSRLASLGDDVRRELATAFAVDTVLAALECPLVEAALVVTDDALLARALQASGVEAIPDGRPGWLNETLELGASELLRRRPALRPVALCADLPALDPDELGAALAAAPQDRAAFVADAAGVGTTLYTAPTLAEFRPRFGPGSRAAHLQAGAVELPAAPTVRRDVDTATDLDAAASLGVGPRTTFVLTRSRLPRPAP